MAGQDIFGLSKGAKDATEETVHRVLGRLSPKSQVTRRVYDSTPLTLMVVSQVDATSGLNMAVTSEGINGIQVFSARSYSTNTDIIEDMPGDDVKVCSRMLTGPLFTGQVFLMAPTGDYPPLALLANDVVGDYVGGGGDGSEFIGFIKSGGTTTGVSEVELRVRTTCRLRTGNRGPRVLAYNDTGRALIPEQSVIVRLLGSAGTVANLRWRISEFTCPPGVLS